MPAVAVGALGKLHGGKQWWSALQWPSTAANTSVRVTIGEVLRVSPRLSCVSPGPLHLRLLQVLSLRTA
jgi:hypothetical protein